MADTHRVVVFNDKRTGNAFTMTVPPSSPWWAALDPVTEADVRVPTAEELADDAAYRAAGGVVLVKNIGKRA